MRVISTGEVLWDIFPAPSGETRELLGGAPLNFAASVRRLGHIVSLITGVGKDTRGQRALERISQLGLSSEFVQRVPEAATGAAVVSMDAEGHASFVIPRPAAFDRLKVDQALLDRIKALSGAWLYFGTLAQWDASNLALLLEIIEGTPAIRGFYDINLREGHWGFPLVQQLSSLAKVIKMNDGEAQILSQLQFPEMVFSLEAFCRAWAQRFEVEVICVTLGSEGCAVFTEDKLRTFRGYPITVVDTVGAGDAFAAGFLHGLSQPWPLEQKAAFANSLGALVASRAGATPDWTLEECEQIRSRIA